MKALRDAQYFRALAEVLCRPGDGRFKRIAVYERRETRFARDPPETEPGRSPRTGLPGPTQGGAGGMRERGGPLCGFGADPVQA